MAASKPDYEESHLVLGWQVNKAEEPRYWLRAGAKPGSQNNSDLVRIGAESIATHTVIIAQSGSGKSFFLGRLLEEILLRTRSRCVVLDPNADFRKVHCIEGDDLWLAAEYDRDTRKGRLTHEDSREVFEKDWTRVSITIKTRTSLNTTPYQPLELRWPALSMDLLAEELDPILRSDLYHCHAFVQSVAGLQRHRDSKEPSSKSTDWIREAERLFKLARQLSEEDFRSMLERDFPKRALFISAFGLVPRRESLIRRVVTAPSYVSDAVMRFYFGKAREYQAAGILQKRLTPNAAGSDALERLQVVDLPSLQDKRTRLLAINALLSAEWDRARQAWSEALSSSGEDTRVPTFIVVDEAHNLIPAKPRDQAERALVEQFLTIVAEGRKYGLFLILVSQRPDKLDPLVVSECENKAIMRLGSKSVLDTTRQMLGIDDVQQTVLEKCLQFEVGRALLIGRWSPEKEQVIYCAARRTVEGGRNLQPKHWAIAPKGPKILEAAEDDNDGSAPADKPPSPPEKPSKTNQTDTEN